MSIRVVATDLDDTLLNDQSVLAEETVREISRVMALGVRVVLCSGRSAPSIRPFAEQLRVNAPYIASNGAEIFDSQTHALLNGRYFGVPEAKACARFAETHGLYVHVYYDDAFFYQDASVNSAYYSRKVLIRGEATKTRVSDFIDRPCAKMITIAPAPVISRAFPEACRLLGDVATVTVSSPTMLEYEPLGVTKADGLYRLAEMQGFTADETVAFGDSLNDMAMLRWAGTGVAVANARADVRAAADDVCPDHNEGGVAQWLRSHIKGDACA